MSPVIRLKGAGKPAPTKNVVTKPAAKKSTPVKPKAAAAKRKPAAAKSSEPKKRARSAPILDQKLLEMHVNKLRTAGKKRDGALKAHKDTVDKLFGVVKAALEDGVPMGIVSEESNTSRQWLYKMGSYNGRDGSTTKAAAAKKKPARKKPAPKATAKPAARGRSRGSAVSKPAGQSRVRVRS